jgi:hypothetical protein
MKLERLFITIIHIQYLIIPVSALEKTAEAQSTVYKRTGEIPICYRVILKDGGMEGL